MANLDPNYPDQKEKVDLSLSTQTTDFDLHNFHIKFRLYPYHLLKKFLSTLGESLDNKSVVVLGCGKGFDFHLIKHCFVNTE